MVVSCIDVERVLASQTQRIGGALSPRPHCPRCRYHCILATDKMVQATFAKLQLALFMMILMIHVNLLRHLRPIKGSIERFWKERSWNGSGWH